MFTVKRIVRTELGEVTRLYEADSVEAAFRDEPPPGARCWLSAPWQIDGRRFVERALVIVNDAFGGRSFDRGTVYVMNRDGATVSKYVLDDSIQPVSRPLEEIAA